MTNQESPRPWHVGDWPRLAWLETAIKCLAFIIGGVILVATLIEGAYLFPRDLRLVQLIIQLILAIGLVAAIADRWIERELISLFFVIPNVIVHWGVALALVSKVQFDVALSLFFGLMLVGDLVKIRFLSKHQFSVRDVSPTILYGLTLTYVVGYSLNLIIQLIR
ncbi:MAG: hypothetical protein AAF485_08535 [Chloroflexota bacterium]